MDVMINSEVLARLAKTYSVTLPEFGAAQDRAWEVLAAVGLGPDGKKKPLTVGGVPVELKNGDLWGHLGRLVTGYVLRTATPAELAAIRKALGVPEPQPERSCPTCAHYDIHRGTCDRTCTGGKVCGADWAQWEPRHE